MRTSGPANPSNAALTTKPKEIEIINLVSDDEDEDEARMQELERLLSSSQEKKAAYGRCVSLCSYRADIRCRQQETPLRLFLQTSMLSTDTEAKADDADKENVRTDLVCGGIIH